MPGVCSAGFTTQVFPQTRAAAVIPAQIASGKFRDRSPPPPRGGGISSISPMNAPVDGIEEPDRLAA